MPPYKTFRIVSKKKELERLDADEVGAPDIPIILITLI